MIIDRDTSTLLCTIDSTYPQYVREDGTILVKLKKNLYGLIIPGVLQKKQFFPYRVTCHQHRHHPAKCGY
jgi:hypothetical protein